MGKHAPANLNDRLKLDLEAKYGAGNVFVEGVGQKLSPTRVVVKHDGHEHEFATTVDFDEFYRNIAKGLDH